MNPAELREMFRFLRGARALGAAEVELVANGGGLTARVRFEGAPPDVVPRQVLGDGAEPEPEPEPPPADTDALGGPGIREAIAIALGPEAPEDAAKKAEDERTYWSS